MTQKRERMARHVRPRRDQLNSRRLAPDIRIDAPRGREVGLGPGLVALFTLRKAAIEEGFGEIRVELDGSVVVLDGAVVLTFGGCKRSRDC